MLPLHSGVRTLARLLAPLQRETDVNPARGWVTLHMRVGSTHPWRFCLHSSSVTRGVAKQTHPNLPLLSIYNTVTVGYINWKESVRVNILAFIHHLHHDCSGGPRPISFEACLRRRSYEVDTCVDLAAFRTTYRAVRKDLAVQSCGLSSAEDRGPGSNDLPMQSPLSSKCAQTSL